jgi:hypothetical protein
VENANFAKDGVPWMEKEEWLRVFRMLKEGDGVNAVRFHTWCPPEAAFQAADELEELFIDMHMDVEIFMAILLHKLDIQQDIMHIDNQLILPLICILMPIIAMAIGQIVIHFIII